MFPVKQLFRIKSHCFDSKKKVYIYFSLKVSGVKLLVASQNVIKWNINFNIKLYLGKKEK